MLYIRFMQASIMRTSKHVKRGVAGGGAGQIPFERCPHRRRRKTNFPNTPQSLLAAAARLEQRLYQRRNVRRLPAKLHSRVGDEPHHREIEDRILRGSRRRRRAGGRGDRSCA